MKWTRSTRSEYLEDRRQAQPGRPSRRSGYRPRRGRRATLGGGSIVVLLVALFFGRNYLGLGSSSGRTGASYTSGSGISPGNDPDAELVDFINFVLEDVQATWDKELPDQLGKPYRPVRLVLFSEAIDSACGYASAAIGPFYCPGDKKAYIDLTFYGELDRRFGAPGDFAQAYVIAHEIGHHIQNLLGTSARVHRERARMSKVDANALTVRLELQADCLAGVWAHSTNERDVLEKGDLEEGLQAATAIGDDTLQKRARGRVTPETFTHGSSAQRVRWFKRGFDSGKVADCDTFNAASL